MREHKFRAWDKERKTMIGSDYPNNWGNDKDEWYDDVNRMNLEGIEDMSNDERFVVLEYTGLKDKYGKKICEGDILKADGIFEVLWHAGGLCCIRRLPHEPKSDGIILDQIEWYLPHSIANMGYEKEIIGNIYENPELIKG